MHCSILTRLHFSPLLLLILLLGVFSTAEAQSSGSSVIYGGSEGIQQNPDLILNGASSSAGDVGATMSIFPTVTKRYLNVRIEGLPSGAYVMGLRRQDGSLINQWTGIFNAGNTLVIDIEKVETGILTFFLQFDGGELSGTFRKVN